MKGVQIPLASRILSIIDSFDVMTHERPYKKVLNKREAINEIKNCSGSQFDPNLVEAFMTFFEKI